MEAVLAARFKGAPRAPVEVGRAAGRGRGFDGRLGRCRRGGPAGRSRRDNEHYPCSGVGTQIEVEPLKGKKVSGAGQWDPTRRGR